MSSIQFDSTEIINTTYVPKNLRHESSPDRDLSLLGLAMEDGEVLINDRYGNKRIIIEGNIKASTVANLETAIDTFKELFSRQEKNLDIAWAGGTRRYVATCIKHEFSREYMHIGFVPWSAEFMVASGEGKDTSETTALNEQVITVTIPATTSFVMSGSKAARPEIIIEGATLGAVQKGIQFKNLDNGEKIIITVNKTWYASSKIRILCNTKEVYEQVASGSVEALADFYGVFPKFGIGTNNIEVSVGGLISQETNVTPADYTDAYTIGDAANNYRLAQSFEVPKRDTTYQGIKLSLSKTGTPTQGITIEIQTDDDNKPSGTEVANATFTIAAASVGATADWVIATSANPFTLEANTKYWIVIRQAAYDASGYYSWHCALTSIYSKGNASRSIDGIPTWTDLPSYDFLFKVLFGGTTTASTAKLTVKYYKTYL